MFNNITISVASLQKGPHVAKYKNEIFIEQVITNLFKKI